MFLNNRRMYINRHPEANKQIEQEHSNDNNHKNDTEDMKHLILDTFKNVSNSIKEINQSISKLNERIESLENRQLTLENQIDSDDTETRRISQSDISDLKSELEILKRSSSDIQSEKYEDSNKPVMPGSGFANITPEFLRNLNKK